MGAKHPTKKQVATLQLLSQNPTMSPTQAMIKAGYSRSTARNPGNKLLKSETTTAIIDKMRLTLQQEGVTSEYLAQKLAQFAYSENSKVFFGAYDRIAKIVGLDNQKQDQQPTRRFTFEEWVSDDTQKPQPLPETQESELVNLQAMDEIELDRHGEAIFSPPNPPKQEESKQQPIIREEIISSSPPFEAQAKRLPNYTQILDTIPASDR